VQASKDAKIVVDEVRRQVKLLSTTANTPRSAWQLGFGTESVTYFNSVPAPVQARIDSLVDDESFQQEVGCLLGANEAREWSEVAGNLTETVEFASVANVNLQNSAFVRSRNNKKAAARVAAVARCSVGAATGAHRCNGCQSSNSSGAVLVNHSGGGGCNGQQATICPEGAPFRTCNANDARLTSGWCRNGITGLAIVLIVIFVLVLFIGVAIAILWNN